MMNVLIQLIKDKLSSFTIKLLIIVFIMILVIVGIQTWLNISTTTQRSEGEEKQNLTTFYNAYINEVKILERASSILSLSFADRPDVQERFLAKDREGLFALLMPVFDTLKTDYDIVHLYLEDPTGTVFLRLHNPEQFGDDVTYRRTVAAALQSRQTAAGVEIGPNRLGIRSVSPMVRQGELVGLIEVGLDYDQDFIEEFKSRHGADYRMWVTNEAAAQAGLKPKDDAPASPIPETFYYAGTDPATLPISAHVYHRVLQSGEPETQFVSKDDQEFAVLIAPLFGYGNRIIGILEISNSRTATLAALQQNFIVTLVVAAGLSMLALALFLILCNFMVTRPLRGLTAVTTAIAAGDLSQQVKITSRDELGTLAMAFNRMTANLRQRIEAEQAATEKAAQLAQEEREAKEYMAQTVDNYLHFVEQIAAGTLTARLSLNGDNDALTTLGYNLNKMAGRLEERTIEAEVAREKAEWAREEAEQARQEIETANKILEAQIWQTAGHTLLNEQMQGEQDIPTLARHIIQQLCKYLDVQVGTLYIRENHVLRLAGSYACAQPKNLVTRFQVGEGLVGQAALEKRYIVITDVPADCITITSSLSKAVPKHLLVAPFSYNGQVVGVIELGIWQKFSPAQLEFLDKALESMAIAFTTAQARSRVNELLAQTQQQAEELQAQEEALRATNEELEAQAESLRVSEANLRLKQVELEEKAVELERTGKYKSEFLANMSHELRTPLNSLLILARMLTVNKEGNLTPEQMESAQIIYNGGVDLLNLINDILDLSKVEAGKLDFHFVPMSLEQFIPPLREQFTHVAEDKGLTFELILADDLPNTIETDPQRVQQIIKNLLSNAFKFTEQGGVRLDIYRPQPGVDLSKSGLDPARAIAIRVTDTGIGLTPEQQEIIFEAFQQADGSTSRQYGGTGLGLSISRELATKLGGQIDLVSKKGTGSSFILYLPIQKSEVQGPELKTVKVSHNGNHKVLKAAPPSLLSSPSPSVLFKAAPQLKVPTLPDDRDNLQGGDRLLLIIEDDPEFARLMFHHAHKKNFKCLVAGDGETGLYLAQTYKVDAIILDLMLPGISGWEVLDELKNNPDTRHIPVHIMSALTENLDAYKRGAIGFLTKPISLEAMDSSFQKIEQFIASRIRTLLLVEDDTNLRRSVRKLLEGNDVAISEASLGQAALKQLASQHFDCMILDLNLPDMSGFELLNRMDGEENLSKCPVIVYTGKALTEEENCELLKYADSVIVKGVRSPERLLDETALFLHQVIANMPEEKQQTIKRLHDTEAILVDKVILIIDDDTRNAFALSKLLADKGLKVHIAPNGQKALDMLDKVSIDLVLMDIMMPGMDGYEVTRRIRAQQRFQRLPILALTAKAMNGDREKCITAGANDYLSKPIDIDRLFSMLRVWLNRE